MPDRVAELEAKVSALTELVASLERRLSALEPSRGQASSPPARAGEIVGARAGGEAAPADPGLALLGAALPLGGRTLLVLAGAFVMRALTDAGVTPGWMGVGLGGAYALGLVLLVERAGRAGASGSATAHGVAAQLIAFPLLFEVVARFRLAGPAAATAVLALVTSALLLVAARRRLEALAWLAVAGSIATALALVFASDRAVPGALFLAVLGVECAWLDHALRWRGLRWVAAAMADLCALAVAVRALSAWSSEGPGAAVLVLSALLAAYLASFGARALLSRDGAGAFEWVQAAGATGVALGGVAILSTHAPVPAAAFGAMAAACGAGAYVAAFAVRSRNPPQSADFAFLGGLAVLLVVAGTALALGRSSLVAIWSALGVASAALAGRLSRPSLAAHAAVYAWAGAVAGGLVAQTGAALLAAPSGGWEHVRAGPTLALAAAAAGAWLSRPAPEPASPAWAVPRLALELLVAYGAAGLAMAALLPRLAESGPWSGAAIDGGRGALAATRTAVVVVVALLLAWAGRRDPWREARWLAYALLAVTGMKILAEDLPGGRPATLIVSLGVYGAALLLVPRLRPRARARRPAEECGHRAPAG